MKQPELEGRYKRLKQELAEAYACSTWDSPHIDRLARELFEIDRVSRGQETEPQALWLTGATSSPNASTIPAVSETVRPVRRSATLTLLTLARFRRRPFGAPGRVYRRSWSPTNQRRVRQLL